MAEVVWTRRAEQDVLDIRDYIAREAPLAALRFSLRLVNAANSLADSPLKGRRIRGALRELATAPPDLIRYRFADDLVEIVRIKHGAQKR